jgi:sulfonate transport system permease protein
MATGFAIGAGSGVLFGLLIGMSKTADRAIAPTYHTLRQVTLFAWIPLLTAWFGTTETAKLVFVSLSAFFPTVLNTAEGLRSIDVRHLETAAVLRLSLAQRIVRVLLPGALPAVYAGLQLALIVAWLSTVGAEYAIGYGQGLGTFLALAREHFRMDLVLAAVFVLGATGFVLGLGCRAVFRRVLRWQGDVR